jgi:hypothetical protein
MIKVGDHVRILNVFKDEAQTIGVTGIVESIDGAYVYVHTPMPDETPNDPCVFEALENEIVFITKKEYFKSILRGDNYI